MDRTAFDVNIQICNKAVCKMKYMKYGILIFVIWKYHLESKMCMWYWRRSICLDPGLMFTPCTLNSQTHMDTKWDPWTQMWVIFSSVVLCVCRLLYVCVMEAQNKWSWTPLVCFSWTIPWGWLTESSASWWTDLSRWNCTAASTSS